MTDQQMKLILSALQAQENLLASILMLLRQQAERDIARDKASLT